MSILVKSPYPIYTDIDGDPLEDGYIFLGEPGLNPLSSPLQAYWDSALTVPASNIRTKGGYPSNNGTPGQLHVDSDYSFLLQDKKGAQVLYTAYSRDTPLIYETELRTFSDNDIIVPSLVHLDGVLDTSLGDALFTLDPGKFEGQQVHLIADGTGIAELTGGNGIYVNSIFITENTGGAHLKWTNSQWVAVNEVTAAYESTSFLISKKTNGFMEMSENNTIVTTETIIYPETFISVPKQVKLSAVSSSPVTPVYFGLGATEIKISVFNLGAVTSAGVNYTLKGSY